MRIKTASQITILGFVCLAVGCQSGDNPWQVDKYRDPGEFKPTPQSTYAPVPRILPTVEGGGFESLEPRDSSDELEQILDELQVK